MNRKKVDSIWLGVSIFFFFMLAISFLLMPLESETPTESISIYTLVAGIVFWISLIVGVVTQFILARRRKIWYVTNRVKRKQFQQKIGMVSFFKNAYAIVADIAAVSSLIGLIIAMVATHGTGYICYVLVSLFVFSFSMHCILNGKNYYYIINQNKLLKTSGKE